MVSLLTLAECQAAGTSDRKETEYGPHFQYEFSDSFEVNGRQGIATDDEYYYVSGSTTLARYDKQGDLELVADEPFAKGYTREVNHIGDIDVYNGEIYCGVEKFLDGKATNIQIAIYDVETLELKRTFNFEPESGQTECSGITVNPDDKTVVMCSWEIILPSLIQFNVSSARN